MEKTLSYNQNNMVDKLSESILDPLDLSYKMDLDFWDCFGREKTLSYNQNNMVDKLSESIFDP